MHNGRNGAFFHAGDIQGKTILLIDAASSMAHYATQFAALGGTNIIGTVGSKEKARDAAHLTG